MGELSRDDSHKASEAQKKRFLSIYWPNQSSFDQKQEYNWHHTWA